MSGVGNQPTQPPIDPDKIKPGRKSRWARRLEQYLNEDPEITRKGMIGVSVSRRGLRSRTVTLTGTAVDAKERERAEEIVRVNASNDVEIDNQIAIDPDSSGVSAGG